MDNLIDQWIQFKMLDVHLGRLADIVHTTTEDVESQVNVDIHEHLGSETDANGLFIPVKGDIEALNLSFRYSEHEPFIFRNLNLSIKAGETVAITGASGCGKSTLLKCLMGLIEPTEGEILVDGKPMKNTPNFRNQIASVMQDDQLMAGDIAENIACFAATIDIKKVRACAYIASIAEDIEQMPMGYNTLVGDMGSSLSGGQKQRVILARAIYRRPRILFMDEATSHLDEHSESIVNRNIRNMQITRIFVAHRQNTVASADRCISF